MTFSLSLSLSLSLCFAVLLIFRVAREDLLRADQRPEKDEVLLDAICYSSVDGMKFN
jgi:hypothetical protein